MKLMCKIQQGFSLVSAIFLLVVIAALGAFAVTLSTTQNQSSALDVQGARAYQAARAGIEWGAYQILVVSGGLGCGAAAAANHAAGFFPGTLSGFAVEVTCSTTPHTNEGIPVNTFLLTATATQGAIGTPNRIERRISVTISR